MTADRRARDRRQDGKRQDSAATPVGHGVLLHQGASEPHSRRVLEVLAKGPGFVAIAKPPGRIVVPGRGRALGETTLRQEVEEQLGQRLWVVHRLDRGTSGVLLFATDAEAHRALSRSFEGRTVVKRYWALVRGTLLGAGEIDRALIPIRGGFVRVARPDEIGGKSSRTAWRALERLGGFTIVEFRPSTGRLHQIRAHAEALGYPLAVDPNYGGASNLTVADLRANGSLASDKADAASEISGGDQMILDGDQIVIARPTLHAWSIKFPHPQTGQSILVEGPPSADLERAVTLLRGLGEKSRGS